MANDGEQPETWRARAAKLKEKHGNGNGAGTPLTIAAQEFWPTPNVPNGGRTLSPESIAAKGSTEKGKRQVGLENVASLWPTPKSSAANYGQPRENDRGDLQAAALSLWPTAGANDWKGTAKPGQRRGQLDEAAEQLWATPTNSMVTLGDLEQAKYAGNGGKRPSYGEAISRFSLPGPPTGTPGSPSSPSVPTLRRQLNVSFVEWMQGFPIGWSDLKPLATPFCLCKRRWRLKCLLDG